MNIKTVVITPDTDAEMEKILTGPTNPLYDIPVPIQQEEVSNLVLLQAEEIKKALQRIFDTDPTARCHLFSFVIYPENKELLEKNGYKVEITGKEPEIFTKVSWNSQTQLIVNIPITTDR